MNTRTVTTALHVPPERAFAYLSQMESLTPWATEFARDLEIADDRHKVVDGLGELFFEIRADAATGVVDMLAGPTEDDLAPSPARIVGAPAGESNFTSALFQQPGVPDGMFAAQYRSLLRGLESVERVLPV